MTQPKNVIFWGAGATQALGIRTTDKQTQAIQHLAGSKFPGIPLQDRIAHALGTNGAEPWRSALFDLIAILGDDAENDNRIDFITDDQFEAMRRNWQSGASDDQLRTRILALRLFYDWPALKSAIRVCPGSQTDNFQLNDLFNMLDMHIPPGFGFRAPAGSAGTWDAPRSETRFLDARRLIGAKNALRMILGAIFYIDYQACLSTKRDVLDTYFGFATEIGRRMQRQGVQLTNRFDQREFYQGDIGFVSLNYDPIGLWIQFIAHRELNNSPTVPHIGSPAVPLHLYHDFGHLIPARRIGGGDSRWPWYPLNEAAAQRLNEPGHPSGYRVRLTKFLFPHGSLCWRECPDCGKLSAYHGDRWDRSATGLFPPPPLRAFDPAPCPDWIQEKERKEREMGRIDARACLHCGTVTYAHHTQTVMQSSFKPQPPSFIEEIRRDLRATTMQAEHIIFMGYSLPPDDVTYRAFFSASRQRPLDRPLRCTIVNKSASNPGWYGPSALKNSKDSVVRAAKDVFGDGNVRFYGGGIPEVFLDGARRATRHTLDQLLDWSST